MKTHCLFGRKGIDIQFRELALDLPPDGVLVKVCACGVCGTDLNFLRDWEEDYQPLGHEISAGVVECGKLVQGYTPGDTVTVEDCAMCGACQDCKSGHPEYCRNMHTLNGIPGMGQYLVVHYGNLNKYEGLSHRHACLTEPLAVALSAVRKAEIPPNGSLLVLGCGPIGLLAARVAKLFGAGFVGITARSGSTPMSHARLSLAEKLGCDLLLRTSSQDVVTEIRRLFPKGVDRVIVTSPPQSMKDAFKLIRFGGTIAFLGLSFSGDSVIPFDVNEAVFNKTTLRPVFAEPAVDFALATELIKQGKVDASLFQTHTFSFHNAKEHFAAALSGDLPVIKSVFLPWE